MHARRSSERGRHAPPRTDADTWTSAASGAPSVTKQQLKRLWYLWKRRSQLLSHVSSACWPRTPAEAWTPVRTPYVRSGSARFLNGYCRLMVKPSLPPAPDAVSQFHRVQTLVPSAAWMFICGRLQPSRKPQGARPPRRAQSPPSSPRVWNSASFTGLPIYGHWQRYKFKFNNTLKSLNESVPS